jgi:hypothetical protein
MIEAILNTTLPDARLMLLFEHRSLYIPRECIIGTPLFQQGPFTPPEDFTGAAAVMDVLKRQQITHVVLVTPETSPDQAPGWRQRQEALLTGIRQCVLEGRLLPIYESEEHLILVVR